MIAEKARTAGVIFLLLIMIIGLATGGEGTWAHTPGIQSRQLETPEQYYYRMLPTMKKKLDSIYGKHHKR